MKRITLKDLDHVVDAINTARGISRATWSVDRNGLGGKCVPTPWQYHLSSAYGGWSLHQRGASGTGIRDVFQVGYVPKRVLHGLLKAYLAGLTASAGWTHLTSIGMFRRRTALRLSSSHGMPMMSGWPKERGRERYGHEVQENDTTLD
ncbi:hypothetical protein CMI37_12525 [Candidatus Pacearchaeota archaeon]|jgi:hypothetical protein|nr:hypothetical protein [Candidatus Pacearchaeota archaeon]